MGLAITSQMILCTSTSNSTQDLQPSHHGMSHIINTEKPSWNINQNAELHQLTNHQFLPQVLTPTMSKDRHHLRVNHTPKEDQKPHTKTITKEMDMSITAHPDMLLLDAPRLVKTSKI